MIQRATRVFVTFTALAMSISRCVRAQIVQSTYRGPWGLEVIAITHSRFHLSGLSARLAAACFSNSRRRPSSILRRLKPMPGWSPNRALGATDWRRRKSQFLAPEVVYYGDMIRELERLLNHFGLTGNYRQVTLGKGVVGKSTSGFISLCGVFGLVAVGLIIAKEPLYLMALAVLGVVAYFYYQHSVLDFAKKNPASALLEGADFVKWHQHETAAKDLKVIPNSPMVSDPQNPIQLEHLSDE